MIGRRSMGGRVRAISAATTPERPLNVALDAAPALKSLIEIGLTADYASACRSKIPFTPF